MDDFFNPNNAQNGSVPQGTPKENAEPVYSEPQAQQINAQQPIFTQQPQQNPYSEQTVNPTSYPPQQGYQTIPQQPQPQNAPIYYNPDGSNNPIAPVPATKDKEKKKGKVSAGKIIFIVLICVSVIISSVAIGAKFFGNGDNVDSSFGSDNSVTDNNSNNQEDLYGEGAAPSIEDSPVSFSEYSGSGTMTAEQVYNHVKDINVGILVYLNGQDAGEGSGIVVGTDKTNTYTYILTAAHVIAEKNIDVSVQFSDGKEYDADIVGLDSKTDVGVLRVKEVGFKAATFGNSDKLNVGQKVYAIGNPGGTEFFGSFTSGIISAIDRPVITNNSSYDLPCIQHNAAINPGNSGGALVNEFGQVIGINSSKISSEEYEGMGFSVPINTVLDVYNQIVKYGYVVNRPMLGITYVSVNNQSYSAIARKNNLPDGSIVIAEISDKSDLKNKDVKSGDIITAVDGEKLETTSVLLEKIEHAKIGDTLTLTICRPNSNGSIEKTFDVTIKLVADNGSTSAPAESNATPFDDYFENFGY